MDLMDDGSRQATLGEVMRVGEFRALWIAHAQSRFGDQLARVALTVLVFDRTDSAALTALTYALTLLPPLVGAPLLSGLADRYPRRTVIVVSESIRTVLVAVMAIPGMPLWVLGILLAGVVVLQPLNSAARNAMLPAVLSGDRYVVGIGLIGATDSTMLVVGFATGGVLTGAIGTSGCLLLDAFTFALSAALVGFGTREHKPAGVPSGGVVGSSLRRGLVLIWTDRRLRSLLGLVYVWGFYIAPEGIAAPYAAELDEGAFAVGLLMAAEPVGSAVGAVLLSRWVRPDRRERLLAPLAISCGAPLVLSAAFPSLMPRWPAGRYSACWRRTR